MDLSEWTMAASALSLCRERLAYTIPQTKPITRGELPVFTASPPVNKTIPIRKTPNSCLENFVLLRLMSKRAHRIPIAKDKKNHFKEPIRLNFSPVAVVKMPTAKEKKPRAKSPSILAI